MESSIAERKSEREGKVLPTVDPVGNGDAALYDRRDGESDERWEAFRAYRDMESPRNIRKLADATHVSRNKLYQWSAADDWTERCRVYDRDLDREQRHARDRELRAMGERQGREAAEIQGALMLPVRALVERINKARVDGVDPWTGEHVSFEKLLNIAERCARAWPTVAAFERLVRGLSTANVEHSGSVNLEVEGMDRSALNRTLAGVDDGADVIEGTAVDLTPQLPPAATGDVR